jgi:hypothetical protein
MRMKMGKSIIRSNYLLDGMGNRFHSGYTSYMGLVSVSNVNYVVKATGVERYVLWRERLLTSGIR